MSSVVMGRAASFSDAETTNRPCRVQSYGSNLQHETCNQHPGCQRADQGSRIGALCPLSVPNSSPTTPLTPTTGHLPPFPGSPIGANALCFPTGIGLPHNRRGSASSPHYQVYPATGLSQLFQTGVRLRGCIIRLLTTACDFG